MASLKSFVQIITLELLCPPPFLLQFSSSGSSLWYSQEWHRYCSYERHETRSHHQVCHPCGHGGYHCHLRPGGVCADSKQVWVVCECVGSVLGKWKKLVYVLHAQFCKLFAFPSFLSECACSVMYVVHTVCMWSTKLFAFELEWATPNFVSFEPFLHWTWLVKCYLCGPHRIL